MNKTLVILVPIVLAGVGFGLGKAGIIHIPGLSPEKKAAKAAAAYLETKDSPPIAKKQDRKESAPPVPKTVAVTIDPVLGRKKLAKLWNGIDTSKLLGITEKWKDDELAQVLAVMSPDKVAAFLSEQKSERASSLSRQIQAIGSRKP